MRILILALVATLAAPLSGSADDAPGALQKLATGDDTRGWEAVGRLDFGAGGFCTGALVSDRLVLTAAHCLFDKHSGARIADTDMQFLAGWRDGRAEAYRGVRRSVAHPDYAYGEEVALDRVAVDLALIELDQPIRRGRIVPFATADRMRKGDEVGVVSYAKDREEAPSLQEVCHVLQMGAGVAMLSCAVDFGASGAPVFRFGDDGPQIVSVVSAKAESDGERVALASGFGRRYAELQAAFAAGPSGALNGGSARIGAFGQRNSSAKFVRP